MILRSILRSLTASTFLIFLVYPSIGTPTEDQGEPVAHCTMIQLNEDIRKLANPNATDHINYVAKVRLKCQGRFYNGKVLGRAPVKNPTENTCDLRHPNQGDTFDLIDNDGALTVLALNLLSDDLKGQFKPFKELITSYVVRKGIDLDTLLNKPYELRSTYYEDCADEKPSYLRCIALGSGVKIIPFSVKDASHFALDPQNNTVFQEIEKLVSKMPLFLHNTHLIKLSIPDGKPFQVETEKDINNISLRLGIPEFSGVKLQNNEFSFFSQENGFKVQRTTTVKTSFNKVDAGTHNAFYLYCTFSDKIKVKIGPIYSKKLRIQRSGPERSWGDDERVEKALLEQAEECLLELASRIYSLLSQP